MTFKETIRDYLDYCSNVANFTERSIIRYKYIIEDVFQSFLFNVVGLEETNVFGYLDTVTYKEIIASLDYYIKEFGVKAEDTCLLYVSVIKEFLKYLTKKDFIKNTSLIYSFGLDDKNENSFNYHGARHIKKLIEESVIKESKEGSPLNEAQIASVIKFCNKKLSIMELGHGSISDKNYNIVVKALITKLVILTGVSVTDRVFQLKIKDMNIVSGFIVINGYKVYLPFNLRNQFLIFFSKVYRGNWDDQNSLIFMLDDGKCIDAAGYIGLFIYNELNRLDIRPLGLKPSSTICLAKYAIIQLIDLGIDRDTIISFTGYEDTVISSCKNYADAGKEITNRKLVSETLKTLPLFNTL